MNKLKFALVLACGAMTLFGCQPEADKPQTLEKQRKLMDGTYKPTKDQLDQAMKGVNIPTPGANDANRTPPPGAMQPGKKGN